MVKNVTVPPVINKNGLIIRGTREWDDREAARMANGHKSRSYGSIEQSIATNGDSSWVRNWKKL